MGIRQNILKAKTEKEVADLGEVAMRFDVASEKTKRRIGLAMTRRLDAIHSEAADAARKTRKEAKRN
jgi:hypothetical protein